jgi:hypothetical protein
MIIDQTWGGVIANNLKEHMGIRYLEGAHGNYREFCKELSAKNMG